MRFGDEWIVGNPDVNARYESIPSALSRRTAIVVGGNDCCRENTTRYMFERFLSLADADRASRTFLKLARHDMRRLALTGGFAIEIHRLRQGCRPSVRSLSDIDFIADSFDSIPESLADGFLFRHIHPLDSPGRTMLQIIDEESAPRVDVFRAYGAAMSRTAPST